MLKLGLGLGLGYTSITVYNCEEKITQKIIDIENNIYVSYFNDRNCRLSLMISVNCMMSSVSKEKS